MSEIIKGIKLIRHNAGGVNELDDPSYPFLLRATFSPPEFMSVAFILMHRGGEEILVRGMTREALEEFADKNNIWTHPRKLSVEIVDTRI